MTKESVLGPYNPSGDAWAALCAGITDWRRDPIGSACLVNILFQGRWRRSSWAPPDVCPSPPRNPQPVKPGDCPTNTPTATATATPKAAPVVISVKRVYDNVAPWSALRLVLPPIAARKVTVTLE